MTTRRIEARLRSCRAAPDTVLPLGRGRMTAKASQIVALTEQARPLPDSPPRQAPAAREPSRTLRPRCCNAPARVAAACRRAARAVALHPLRRAWNSSAYGVPAPHPPHACGRAAAFEIRIATCAPRHLTNERAATLWACCMPGRRMAIHGSNSRIRHQYDDAGPGGVEFGWQQRSWDAQ